MNFNPYVMLYDIQKSSVDYWKNFGIDYSETLNEIWTYPLWEWYFDEYTKPGNCLEGYQYVYGC